MSEQTGPRPASRSLAAETLHGLKWTYLGTFCSAALQIGVTAVMSRLLAPSAYGVMAAAGMFLRFGSYFSEMGVGLAIVQKQDLANEDIRAAFTATTCIGLIVGIVMWLSAPLSRHVLDDPVVVPVVRLLAIAMVMDGMASTSLNLLRRNLRFRVLSIIEVASFGLSYGIIGIPFALVHPNVWALTAVFLAQPFLTLFFAYFVVKHDLRPCLRWQPHRALLSYGSRLSLTNFAEYLFYFAEPSIVGRTWGAAVLGVYNRAMLIATLPVSNASAAMMKVLFPAFSRAQTDSRRLALAYLQGVTMLSLVSLPLAIGMVCGSRAIVLTLLGPQYESATTLVRIFALAIPFSMFATLAATICNVKGEMGTRLSQQAALTVLIWAAVWIAAHRSIYWVAIAAAAAQGVRLIGFQHLARRSLGIRWRELGRAARPGVELAGPVAAAVLLAARVGYPGVPAVCLALEIASASLVCIAYCLWYPPAQLMPLLLRALDSGVQVRQIPLFAWYRSRVVSKLSAASVS